MVDGYDQNILNTCINISKNKRKQGKGNRQVLSKCIILTNKNGIEKAFT